MLTLSKALNKSRKILQTSKDGLVSKAVKMLCVISYSVNKLVIKIKPINKRKNIANQIKKKN